MLWARLSLFDGAVGIPLIMYDWRTGLEFCVMKDDDVMAMTGLTDMFSTLFGYTISSISGTFGGRRGPSLDRVVLDLAAVWRCGLFPSTTGS